MPMPDTEKALTEARYAFDNVGKCRGCHLVIWWYLTPRNRRMPFDPPDAQGKMAPHWGTCENQDRFKGRS